MKTKKRMMEDLVDSWCKGECSKKDLKEAYGLGVVNLWGYNRLRKK